MNNNAGSLNVLEELNAKAVTEVRAFDQPGEVGDGEGGGVGKVADLDDAEVGFKGGEGVVGDLRFGGREPRDQSGLPDVGKADEAGVGQEAQLETVVALFATAAEFMFSGSLMGGGGEVLVASSAASATGDDNGFIGAGEVVDELAGGIVEEEGANGDVEGGVLASLAGAIRA